MTNQYLTTANKIKSNDKVNGKIMSFPQLDTLIKLTCRYDYVLPTKALTVKGATDEITRVMKAVEKGRIVEREKMYKFSHLKEKFIAKYPDVYAEVMNRNC
jgi:hypothetical protein